MKFSSLFSFFKENLKGIGSQPFFIGGINETEKFMWIDSSAFNLTSKSLTENIPLGQCLVLNKEKFFKAIHCFGEQTKLNYLCARAINANLGKAKSIGRLPP